MHSGKLPSILARTSAEEAQPERFLEWVTRLLPRMDGGETWRGARMCGASAMYPGLAPSMLATAARRKPDLAFVSADGSYSCGNKSMANAAVVDAKPKGYHFGMTKCVWRCLVRRLAGCAAQKSLFFGRRPWGQPLFPWSQHSTVGGLAVCPRRRGDRVSQPAIPRRSLISR